MKILELDKDLNRIQDLDVLLERILTTARGVVNADAGSIYIVEDGQLAIKYSQNDTLTKRLKPGQKLIYSFFRIPINEATISGFAALHCQSINVPDMYAIPPEKPYSFNTKFDEQSPPGQQRPHPGGSAADQRHRCGGKNHSLLRG